MKQYPRLVALALAGLVGACIQSDPVDFTKILATADSGVSGGGAGGMLGGTGGSSGATGAGGATDAGGTGGMGGATDAGGMKDAGGARDAGSSLDARDAGGSADARDAGSSVDASVVAPTFTTIYDTILTKSCGGSNCHNPGTQQGVSFSSKSTAYSAVRARVTPGASASSRFYTIVNSGQMPPTSPKLSAANLAAIAAWIDAGALNN